MNHISRHSDGSRLESRQRTRVVVFDPDEIAARSLARTLVSIVSRTYWTTSFTQAKQLIIEKGCNVLVANCQTDEATGIKVLSDFHEDVPDVAIVAMSRLPAEEPEARAAGACAFLHKPVRTSELTETINGIRKARREEAKASGHGLLNSTHRRLGN